jgi:hypothetical protein
LRGHFTAAAALSCVAAGLALPVALPTSEAATTTQAEECTGENFFFELASAAISLTLSPGISSEAFQHQPITFAGESPFPLTFRVASSESRLAHPDVDSGAGTASAGEKATRWSFTSSKAVAKLGKFYWSATFTQNLPNCAGGKGEVRTFSTAALGAPARSFVVLPASEEPEKLTVLPCTAAYTECSPPTPTGLRTRITAKRLVHIGHPAVAYLVQCTAACSGKTSFKAWELKGRHKAIRERALDFGPRQVSITNGGGGNERFIAHFRGSALRTLMSVLRSNHEIKLQITARVKDSKGNYVQAPARVVLLKR